MGLSIKLLEERRQAAFFVMRLGIVSWPSRPTLVTARSLEQRCGELSLVSRLRGTWDFGELNYSWIQLLPLLSFPKRETLLTIIAQRFWISTS
ncbi:hypothetical protein LINPERHAP2_LOCUS15838 [Linum perenne]